LSAVYALAVVTVDELFTVFFDNVKRLLVSVDVTQIHQIQRVITEA